MNKFLFWISALLMLSNVSLANKIMITGRPVVLEREGSAYYTPGNYRQVSDYYYVIVEGNRFICYLNNQPRLSALNMRLLQVIDNGSFLEWYCYPFDVNYFEER